MGVMFTYSEVSPCWFFLLSMCRNIEYALARFFTIRRIVVALFLDFA